jgi:hypothetical protein
MDYVYFTCALFKDALTSPDYTAWKHALSGNANEGETLNRI